MTPDFFVCELPAQSTMLREHGRPTAGYLVHQVKASTSIKYKDMFQSPKACATGLHSSTSLTPALLHCCEVLSAETRLLFPAALQSIGAGLLRLTAS